MIYALIYEDKICDVVRFVLTNKDSRRTDSLPSELLGQSGIVLQEPLVISNELVNFFTDIPAVLKEKLVQENFNRPRRLTLNYETTQEIFSVTVAQHDVASAISSMKSTSASGYDNIPVSFLKSNARTLVPVLTRAMNVAALTGYFPDSLKMARLSCIYKSGDHRLPTNYRPISVLPVFSRTVEKVIYTKLIDYVMGANIIHPNQFGFIPSSNTNCATLCATTRMIDAIEAKNFTIALFIDVSKAFDCVDHGILLNKLHKYGISGNLLGLISSYLFGRKHQLISKDIQSQQRFVRNGVPQGSSLSSLLFLMYINDILDLELTGYLQLYADDALLIYSGNNISNLCKDINNDLEIINTWFYNNLLSFNADKSSYILITPKGKNVSTMPLIHVKNVPVTRVQSAKYLGLMIDEHLQWNAHIDLITRKIRPILAMLRRTSYLLPQETKLSVYYAHIHSHLTYMTSVWGATAHFRIDHLQRLQNKALRFIFWREYRNGNISTAGLYKKYKILKMNEVVKYEHVMNIYKIKHQLLNVNFNLSANHERHQHNTRRRSQLQTPASRTNYSRYSMFHEGVNEYNRLPSHLRHCDNLLIFKRLLKQHLSRNY